MQNGNYAMSALQLERVGNAAVLLNDSLRFVFQPDIVRTFRMVSAMPSEKERKADEAERALCERMTALTTDLSRSEDTSSASTSSADTKRHDIQAKADMTNSAQGLDSKSKQCKSTASESKRVSKNQAPIECRYHYVYMTANPLVRTVEDRPQDRPQPVDQLDIDSEWQEIKRTLKQTNKRLEISSANATLGETAFVLHGIAYS